MEITYQLRPDDLLALTDDFVSRSPTVRRAFRRPVLLLCTYLVLASILLGWLTHSIELVLTILVFGGILAAFIPARMKRSQRRMTVSMYREGKNRALFLPMTLTIDRDNLSWRAASGAGHVKLEYVERVHQTGTHLLIYVNVRNAYIVPRDGVKAGDFDAFAQEVERRWRNAMDCVDEPHPMHAI